MQTALFAPLDALAGCDEVGRGTWAGPVVAAAVMLDPQRPIAGLADSKKLSPQRRSQLDARIREQALGWAIGQASAAEIDSMNILQATLLAMQRAVAALPQQPTLLLVDGNHLPQVAMPARAVIGGDASEAAISAASIVAKVWRDRLMVDLDQQFPGYGFAQHKGYGTADHAAALTRLGPCAEHRRSFAPIRKLIGVQEIRR